MAILKPSLRFTTPIKIFSTLLLVLTFLLSCSASSSPEDQNTPVPATSVAYYRVFHIKNKQAQEWRRYKKKKNMEYRKKKRGSNVINIDTRAFSTMLPKGFVPPSGSSPCHNDFPNSITFFCQLSSQKP
ncbi:Alpha-mannosidase 3 [Heracleum sosnowskyi]|uniref:Alpha-mannosidase 3 n=1 Tax=Heracleum sosnowskyi TaxID=360622 RepID=A0AAD8HM95_9APIA|nr:Alpha-mannosidase 3 [Heracleum sosnowskyi]